MHKNKKNKTEQNTTMKNSIECSKQYRPMAGVPRLINHKEEGNLGPIWVQWVFVCWD